MLDALQQRRVGLEHEDGLGLVYCTSCAAAEFGVLDVEKALVGLGRSPGVERG